MSMIRVQALSKFFGSHPAVQNIDFEVAAGQSLCLIGSSGSGKTTTLKMLNRLIEPSSGQITIQGQSILKQDPIALRRQMGYVIQSGGLFPHLTVFDNIALLPQIEGWNPTQQHDRVSELLEHVALPQSYASRYPADLSGGEQQRVGVARALALKPPILLMDEPFGALDPITRRQLQDCFLEIKAHSQVTSIMVTHDLREAFRCGDSIALMHQGQMVQQGSAEQLQTEPINDFVQDFVTVHLS